MTLSFLISNVQVPRATSAILPAKVPGASAVQASPALPSMPPGATTYSAEIVDADRRRGRRAGTRGRSRSDAGGVPGPVTVTAFEKIRACELFATVMTFGLSFHEPVMFVSPFAPALPDEAATTTPASTAASSALRIGSCRRVGRQPAAVAEADVERVGLVGDDVLDRGEELRRVTVEAVAHDVRAGGDPREPQREGGRTGRVVVGAFPPAMIPRDVGAVERARAPRRRHRVAGVRVDVARR